MHRPHHQLKNNDENAWALLARDANLKDPNTDYRPLHAWSNDPAVTYQLTRPGKAKAYHEGVPLSEWLMRLPIHEWKCLPFRK